MIHSFLFNSQNIIKSSYLWNTAAGILNALQSIVLLAIVSRAIGVNDAGILSIAWAIAYLALTLGLFGMRAYQVTDSKDMFTTENYISSRVVTCMLMLLFAVAYIIYGVKLLAYNTYKCEVIALLTIWKAMEAYEDIYHGWFQKNGRLDVAAKAATTRYIVGIVAFTIALLLSKSLVVAIFAIIIVSGVIIWLLTLRQGRYFEKRKTLQFDKNTWHLLKECLSLCVVNFLTIYVGNIPKYAIDLYMNDEAQAYYNYIFMPVFAIGLLAGFIYNPLLKDMACAWNQRKIDVFKKIIYKQIFYIAIITIVVLIGAYFVGTPMLGVVFGANVNSYKAELLILLLGGGLIALANFIMLIIATLRKQYVLIIAYGVAAITAKIAAAFLVSHLGITGAAYTYTFSTMVLVAVLIVSLIRISKTEKNRHERYKDGIIDNNTCL